MKAVSKRSLFLTLFLCGNPLAQAQTCPDYTSNDGDEIQFSTADVYKKYGFQKFHPSPGRVKATSYETLAGKKAKFLGKVSAENGILQYRELIVEDCSHIYWHDLNGTLEPMDAKLSGFEFMKPPTTNWLVSEKIDPITDAKSCAIMAQTRKPCPMFFYHSKEGFSIAAVGGDFPGRQVSVRVDGNKAISGNESISGANAKAVASQIRAGGKSLLLSAYEWPNDYQIISDPINLFGLVKKLDHCNAWVRK